MTIADDSIQLVLAAEKGDLGTVRRLVAEGVAIDQPDSRESSRLQTPLMRASVSGHVETVRALLEAGADVNARSTDGTPLTQGEKVMLYHTSAEDTEEAGVALGWTALHLAARADEPEVIEVLLEAGADVEAETLFKARPIHTAVDAESANALRLLLDAGANVNARGSSKATPLHDAALWGEDAILKMLIHAKGVKLDLKDGEGNTALMMAIDHDRQRCVHLLLAAGADVAVKDRKGKTAADHAQEAGGDMRSFFFAKTGVDKPKVTDKQLYEAVTEGDLETIQDAIDQGADLNKQYSNWALLPTAVLYADVNTVQMLLDAGADVNQKNGRSGADEYQGASALMMTFVVSSSSDAKLESIRTVLLEAGADINTTNASGWTPLMYVATYLNPDYTRRCLAMGADATFRTPYGETALSALRAEWIATQKSLTPENKGEFRDRYEQVQQILTDAGAEDRPAIESEAFQCVTTKDNARLAELLNQGLDPNTADFQGTLLQRCLHGGLYDLAATLLDAGADAAQTTPADSTPPLYAAVGHGDVDLITKMLSHGADPSVEYEGQHILDFLPRKKEQRESIRQLLVDAAPELAVTKADLGVTSFDGNYECLLVKAAGRKVAQAIAKLLPCEAKQWQPREGIPVISGYLILMWTDRVDPIRWATVHPLRNPKRQAYDRQFAEKLSAEVNNDVIFFQNSDTAGYAGYDYFRKGKLVEQFQLFPEDSVTLDGDPVFESSLRKTNLPTDGSLLAFVSDSFAQFGAYVPGFEDIDDIEVAGDRVRGHFVVKAEE